MNVVRRLRSPWVSAHIFFHGDLDVLLISVLGPLVDELCANEMATDFFFVRYWDGGPHLRVRIRPVDRRLRVRAERLIRARFEAFLRFHPATARMSDVDYARLAPELAGREGMPTYAERLVPNNTVRLIPYRPEHGRYGHGAALEAVERHFTDSSRIALGVLTRGATASQRTTAALALTLLTWFVAYPVRGRPNDFVPASGRAPGLTGDNRGDLDRVVLLARQMRALATCRREPAPASASLTAWEQSISTLLAALANGEHTGTVLDLCAHLVCNRLGVSIGEESAIRQVAAAAVGELNEERS